MMISAVPAVAAIVGTNPSGISDQLDPNSPLPAWAYKVIHDTSDRTLKGNVNAFRRWEVNCYGSTSADAIRLASAIDTVLDGFFGTLPDPDSTFVTISNRVGSMSFFDDSQRTWRRMLEYEIWYHPL